MNDNPRLRTIRIVGLCILAFLIMLSYSLARPAAESLFLDAHTHAGLPVVWLLVTVVVLTVVTVYNRFVARSDLLRLLGASALIAAVLLVLLLCAEAAGLPGAYYALYVWKDIYVVVLVEIYYSFSNSIFPIKSARWLYGLFGAVGAVGGIIGNLWVGWLAEQYGSANALWVVVPFLVAIYLVCISFQRKAGLGTPLQKEKTSIREALSVVKGSSYLLLVLGLVALVQSVITLVDYEYNQLIEHTYPDQDIRTGIIGQIYAVTAALTVVLHGLTGPILRLSGVPLVLLGIPLLLGLGAGVFAVFPAFLTVAVVKIGSKTFDYTLFRNAKEILYIPLNYAERTMGKSVADMTVYRIAKGLTSLLILGLLALGAACLVTPLTIVMILAWVTVTIVVVRRFRRKVSREDEMDAAA